MNRDTAEMLIADAVSILRGEGSTILDILPQALNLPHGDRDLLLTVVAANIQLSSAFSLLMGLSYNNGLTWLSAISRAQMEHLVQDMHERLNLDGSSN